MLSKQPNILKEMQNRIPLDEYFLKIALVIAERSTCLQHHIGAVAVRDKQILSTGYNGAATKTKDCLELGCLRDAANIASGHEAQLCRAIHAEQNAIIQASLHGVSLEKATIYCTHTPCIICAKMLINAKISNFVSCGEYSDKSFIELFKETNILASFIKIKDLNITRLN